MPYIKERVWIDERLELLLDDITHGKITPGEVNYMITEILLAWVDSQDIKNYATLNAAIGILESAKLEFYRREVVPYEDEKRKENGDVY